MKVIFDCNIWISFLIGHHSELLQRILNDQRFDIIICSELVGEIQDVCSRFKIRSRVSDKDLDYFFQIIYAYCHFTEIDHETEHDIRDPKDIYLLSLAESVGADYIVSGDADLIDLNQVGKTKMLTLSEFKALF